MRQSWTCLAAVLLVAAARGGNGQTPTETRDRVRAALKLPGVVDSARRERVLVSESEVRSVITEARRRRIPASETHDILQTADAAAREHGPVNNFGAFVQSQLAAGKRGRALADAIRQEHARRGIGGGNARAAKGGGRDTAKARQAGNVKAGNAKAGNAKAGNAKAGNAKAGTTKAGTTKAGTTKTSPTKTKAGATTSTKTKTKGRP